jgi:hypothetical protein
MSLFWRLMAPRSLRRSFVRVRHGHRCVPLRSQEVLCDDLRVRWEPLLIPKRSEDLHDVYGSPHWRAENPIERFFPLTEGIRDRRLVHTPHVALLKAYSDQGSVPSHSDYVRLMRVRARLQGRQRDEEFYRLKVDRLIAVFNSIRQRGYRGGRSWRHPVTVFQHPLAPVSAGYEPKNWEIFDGHHRAAVLASLGIKKVKVLVLRAMKVEPYDWTIDIPWQEGWWQSLGGIDADPVSSQELLG